MSDAGHPMTQSPPTGELVARIREACIGHPHAKIAWPHRILHEAADAITTLERELEDARALSARLKLEAQGHASEARTANSTIYEIYQALSGGRGEPGNWNGAEPARRFVAASQAEVERLKALVETAFRDGLTYGTNVIVTDADEAWRTSRVRAALQVEESKT